MPRSLSETKIRHFNHSLMRVDERNVGFFDRNSFILGLSRRIGADEIALIVMNVNSQCR